VNVAVYTGRPVTAVQSELRTVGLLTQARTLQGLAPTNPATCTVTDVSPAGTLRKGSVVTITCVQH
jgi:serine/threonine-protein kinase